MAIKIICDRCKCEINGRSDNYRKIYFMFGHDDDVEEYDLCPDCFTSIKRSIVNNLLEYESMNAHRSKRGQTEK